MNTQDKTILSDILIVDDKLENIRFLSDFLSKHNYQVRKAINGKTALTAIQTVQPDLILLDINMPGMGGYEVCEYLKSDPITSSIPVIFLSAGSDVQDKLKAFEVGGIDYITKPFQLEEVLARIQTQLKIKSLQQELESRNKQLQKTLLLLQNTQAELIQKEKLINSGRIAAGISHEINNPLSFILCNLAPASEYSHKLVNLVKIYRQAFPEGTPEIKNFIDDMELDFINSDFTKIIDSMYTGAERIRSVIQAIHVFSRLDQSGVKPFSVNESIDSTLMTLSYQFELKETVSISVIKNYTDIPEAQGYANIFNQAVMNILQNSIDALTAKFNLHHEDTIFKPTIWIQSKLTATNKIMISIRDNGIGIDKKYQERIFEPFFSTKSRQTGTGLGLYTSYQIITDIHKGSLFYQDCSEGGSEFIIELPIHQKEIAAWKI
ncbi:MAG: hybrid sensor histidine kinase/response regulator [Nostocales cyanobacterium]|nr:MAG: hybrid sensor histidine kinase/response regulator [Nostocales cyanobacterium]